MEKCHSWFDALNCVYIYYVNCHWNCIKVLRSVHFVHWCKNRISKMNLQITIKKPVMKAANKKKTKKHVHVWNPTPGLHRSLPLWPPWTFVDMCVIAHAYMQLDLWVDCTSVSRLVVGTACERWPWTAYSDVKLHQEDEEEGFGHIAKRFVCRLIAALSCFAVVVVLCCSEESRRQRNCFVMVSQPWPLCLGDEKAEK